MQQRCCCPELRTADGELQRCQLRVGFGGGLHRQLIVGAGLQELFADFDVSGCGSVMQGSPTLVVECVEGATDTEVLIHGASNVCDTGRVSATARNV